MARHLLLFLFDLIPFALQHCFEQDYILEKNCTVGTPVFGANECRRACCYMKIELPKDMRPRKTTKGKPCFRDKKRKCRQKPYTKKAHRHPRAKQICKGTKI